MSWDINHVVLVGRLTKDPELTYTQSGAAVCRFSIAVNRSSSSSSEDREAKTNFFNIVSWNKTAEICKEYLKKGRQVGIDGRLQQRRWEGPDGVKRSTVDIVASTVQFFGPARESAATYESPESMEEETGEVVSPPLSVKESVSKESISEEEPFLSELDDDEIPF